MGDDLAFGKHFQHAVHARHAGFDHVLVLVDVEHHGKTDLFAGFVEQEVLGIVEHQVHAVVFTEGDGTIGFLAFEDLHRFVDSLHLTGIDDRHAVDAALVRAEVFDQLLSLIFGPCARPLVIERADDALFDVAFLHPLGDGAESERRDRHGVDVRIDETDVGGRFGSGWEFGLKCDHGLRITFA